MRKEESLLRLMDSEDAPRCSGLFKSMQRPWMRQCARSTTAELGHVGVKRKEEEEAAAGGKSENGGPLSLFIRQWIDGMGEN